MTRHSARLHSSQPSKQAHAQAHNKNHDNRTRNAASMGLGVNDASKHIQKRSSPAASKQHHPTTTEKSGSGQRSAQEAISPALFEAIRAVIKEEISSTTSSSASPLQKLIQQEIRKQLAASGIAPSAIAVDARYRINLMNRIRDNLYAPSHAQSELSAEDGTPLTVCITNVDGTLTSDLDGLKLEAVLLQANPLGGAAGGWIPAIPRPGHTKALLAGTVTTTIQKGRASFATPEGRDVIRVTDNSSKFPDAHFVLEVRPIVGTEGGPGENLVEGEVEAARTEPFRVKSSRAKENEKKGADIKLKDPVFRLRNICKHGELDRRLKKLGVVTVGDFVQKVTQNESGVREALGKGMSDALWKDTWAHALMAVEGANGRLQTTAPTMPSPTRPAARAHGHTPPPSFASTLYHPPTSLTRTSPGLATAPTEAATGLMAPPPVPRKNTDPVAPLPSRAPSFDFEGFFSTLGGPSGTLSRGNSLLRLPSSTAPVAIGAIQPSDSGALLPTSGSLFPGASAIFNTPSLQEALKQQQPHNENLPLKKRQHDAAA